jgi:hypothetical protein
MCSGWFHREHFLKITSLMSVDAGDEFVGEEFTKMFGGPDKVQGSSDLCEAGQKPFSGASYELLRKVVDQVRE